VTSDRQALPGETPIDDVSGLKVKGIRSRAELNAAEAENIRRAVVKYLSKKPTRRSARFDYAWSLKLHREMLGRVWAWAGRPRVSDTNLGVPWRQIEPRLFGLLGDLAVWKTSGMDMVEQAALLHHRAVQIHPFTNGNGRWARLLANIWLKLHDAPLTVWPEETIGAASPIREEYLAAIRQADEGDYDALTELHRLRPRHPLSGEDGLVGADIDASS
jgi:Fic-DOC domain mobile mystery protein B